MAMQQVRFTYTDPDTNKRKSIVVVLWDDDAIAIAQKLQEIRAEQ